MPAIRSQSTDYSFIIVAYGFTMVYVDCRLDRDDMLQILIEYSDRSPLAPPQCQRSTLISREDFVERRLSDREY